MADVPIPWPQTYLAGTTYGGSAGPLAVSQPPCYTMARKAYILKLPNELLIMILKPLLLAQDVVLDFDSSGNSLIRNSSDGLQASNLAVCTDFYNLGLPMLYGSHRFQFSSPSTALLFFQRFSSSPSLQSPLESLNKVGIRIPRQLWKHNISALKRDFNELHHMASYLPKLSIRLSDGLVRRCGEEGVFAKALKEVLSAWILKRYERNLARYGDDISSNAVAVLQDVLNLFEFEGRGRMYMKRTDPGYVKGGIDYGDAQMAKFAKRWMKHVLDGLTSLNLDSAILSAFRSAVQQDQVDVHFVDIPAQSYLQLTDHGVAMPMHLSYQRISREGFSAWPAVAPVVAPPSFQSRYNLILAFSRAYEDEILLAQRRAVVGIPTKPTSSADTYRAHDCFWDLRLNITTAHFSHIKRVQNAPDVKIGDTMIELWHCKLNHQEVFFFDHPSNYYFQHLELRFAPCRASRSQSFESTTSTDKHHFTDDTTAAPNASIGYCQHVACHFYDLFHRLSKIGIVSNLKVWHRIKPCQSQ